MQYEVFLNFSADSKLRIPSSAVIESLLERIHTESPSDLNYTEFLACMLKITKQ